MHEVALPIEQPELLEYPGVSERCAMRLAKGPEDERAAFLQEPVLRGRQESRAQDSTQGAVAEEESARP